MTSTDIALKSGVSEASVIRFARKLGFSGFTGLQKWLRQYFYKGQVRISEDITVPYERLLKSLEHEDDEFVEKYALSVQQNIYSAISGNSREDYERSVDILLNSRYKYIYGFRHNYGLAVSIYFILNCMLPDVRFVTPFAGASLDSMLDISDQDSIVIFSFPRYSLGCKVVADMAHAAGAKIISITDRISAPVAEHASVALKAESSGPFFFNSFVGVQHVLETVCAGVSSRIKDAYADKLKNLDDYLNVTKMY